MVLFILNKWEEISHGYAQKAKNVLNNLKFSDTIEHTIMLIMLVSDILCDLLVSM